MNFCVVARGCCLGDPTENNLNSVRCMFDKCRENTRQAAENCGFSSARLEERFAFDVSSHEVKSYDSIH